MVSVIILSSDYNFKTKLMIELKKERNFDIMTSALDLVQASSLMKKNLQFVIILDVTTVQATDAYLKELIERFNVLVIVVRGSTPVSFFRSGVKDCLFKPPSGSQILLESFTKDVINRIRGFLTASPPLSAQDYFGAVGPEQTMILIASSTGGTEALVELFKTLPGDGPPILVVQHMPMLFTKQFADRLDRLSQVSVCEASDGMYIKKGMAYIAPGDFHMKMIKKNSKCALSIFSADKVHGVRPAADVLFQSVALLAAKPTLSVILTGMGSDGAFGMRDLKKKGGKTIAQNKETCVVFGMPKAAIDLGIIDHVLPLDRISAKIVELVY